VGICGGYQMLGRTVADPRGVESTSPAAAGLSLLPAATVMLDSKRTEAVQAVLPNGARFGGYAIHAGHTTPIDGVQWEPFATIVDGSPDGMRVGRVTGTYLHGALENPHVCERLFGVRPATDHKQASYDRLADWFDSHARHTDRWGLPAFERITSR